MRRVLREALMSAGTVVILLLVLIAFDDRVRDQVSRRFVAHPSVELASAGRQLQDLTTVILGGRAHTEPRTRAAADLRAGGGGAHALHAANLNVHCSRDRTGPAPGRPSHRHRAAAGRRRAGHRGHDRGRARRDRQPRARSRARARAALSAGRCGAGRGAARHRGGRARPHADDSGPGQRHQERAPAGGMLAKWRKNRAASPEPEGCDPAVFGEQISTYLQEAAAERAQIAEDELLADEPMPAAPPTMIEPVAIAAAPPSPMDDAPPEFALALQDDERPVRAGGCCGTAAACVRRAAVGRITRAMGRRAGATRRRPIHSRSRRSSRRRAADRSLRRARRICPTSRTPSGSMARRSASTRSRPTPTIRSNRST